MLQLIYANNLFKNYKYQIKIPSAMSDKYLFEINFKNLKQQHRTSIQ